MTLEINNKINEEKHTVHMTILPFLFRGKPYSMMIVNDNESLEEKCFFSLQFFMYAK